jgi:hypothetical protein
MCEFGITQQKDKKFTLENLTITLCGIVLLCAVFSLAAQVILERV